jgi:hypothetical protein
LSLCISIDATQHDGKCGAVLGKRNFISKTLLVIEQLAKVDTIVLIKQVRLPIKIKHISYKRKVTRRI